MRSSLSDLQNLSVQLARDENLADLEYADDIVLLFDDVQKTQDCLDRLSVTIPSFGMRFAPGKCKAMLQDCPSLTSPLKISGMPVEVVKHFTYLCSRINSDSSVIEEVQSRILC